MIDPSPERVLCQFLDWDSDFFGFRIACVILDSPSEGDLESALAWCRSNQVECLYFLCDAASTASSKAACTLGFDLVDVRVTMVRRNGMSLPPNRNDVVVQPAEASDAALLLDLAGRSFTASRFYVDTRFPRVRVDSLFQCWLQRDLHSAGHRVMVVKSGGTIVGFASGSIDHDQGRVSLVAVDEAARGKGAGEAGLLGLLTFFQEAGAEKITVVTQAQNASAIRLYENCGFRTMSIQLWFHKWFGQNDAT